MLPTLSILMLVSLAQSLVLSQMTFYRSTRDVGIFNYLTAYSNVVLNIVSFTYYGKSIIGIMSMIASVYVCLIVTLGARYDGF